MKYEPYNVKAITTIGCAWVQNLGELILKNLNIKFKKLNFIATFLNFMALKLICRHPSQVETLATID